jgi:hypothetical protein
VFIVIIAHSDHELVFDPNQQMSEGEAASVEGIYEAWEERSRGYGRIRDRSRERPFAAYAQSVR